MNKKLQRLLYLFFVYFFGIATTQALADEGSTCHGYRYIYMDARAAEIEEKARFFACKKIIEPSSRPAACDLIGSIETKKYNQTKKKIQSRFLSYSKGVLAGATCVVFTHAATLINKPISFFVRTGNLAIDEVEYEKLRQEVIGGKRKLGEIPIPDSKLHSTTSAICSYATGAGKESSFNRGANSTIKTYTDYIHRIKAIKADADLIWAETDIEKRLADFEMYKKNIALQNKVEALSLSKVAGGAKAIYDYMSSGGIISSPIGISDDIVIVSPKTCISMFDIFLLKAYIAKVTDTLNQAKKLVDEDEISHIKETAVDLSTTASNYAIIKNRHATPAETLNTQPIADECDKKQSRSNLVLTPHPAPEKCRDTKTEGITANLNFITPTLQAQNEALLYSLLAKQKQNEMKCAINFTETIEEQNSQGAKKLLAMLKFLRESKIRIAIAAKNISENKLLLAKACPLSLSDLAKNPMLADNTEDEYYENCRDIILQRAAAANMKQAIPLSQMEIIGDFIQDYISAPEELDNETALKKIKTAYSEANSFLEKIKDGLESAANGKEGLEYYQNADQSLFDDPRLVAKVLKNTDLPSTVQDVACRALKKISLSEKNIVTAEADRKSQLNELAPQKIQKYLDAMASNCPPSPPLVEGEQCVSSATKESFDQEYCSLKQWVAALGIHSEL